MDYKLNMCNHFICMYVGGDMCFNLVVVEIELMFEEGLRLIECCHALIAYARLENTGISLSHQRCCVDVHHHGFA